MQTIAKRRPQTGIYQDAAKTSEAYEFYKKGGDVSDRDVVELGPG